MTLDRRNFVKGGLALGAAAALPGLSPIPSLADSTTIPWDDLRAELDGSLVLPGDAPYLGLATPRALRYLRESPQGIAVVAGANDCALAVGFAREHGLPVRVRGGGHGYAGYSTTPGLQIDMSGMRDVSFDETTGFADFGGGARGVEEAEGLEPHGAFIPSGSCSGVGLAGFAQGGGFGRYSRQHGLGCDTLVEAEIVTASGDTLVASENEHPDAFWAVRGGGGGNFGVVTRTRLRTFPTDNPVSVSTTIWRGVNVSELMASLLPMMEASPESMSWQFTCDATSPFNITGNSTPQVTLHCHNFGPARQIEKELAPVVRKWKPASKLVTGLTFWQAHTFFTSIGLPETSLWYVKSVFVKGPVPRDVVDRIADASAAWPGSSIGRSGVGFTPWNGQVTKPSPTDTAFVHREEGNLIVIQTCWGNDDPPELIRKGKEWADRLYADLLPASTGGSYQNWIDPELKNPLEAYYGQNLPRLKKVKRQVDPDDIFSIPQGIPAGGK